MVVLIALLACVPSAESDRVRSANRDDGPTFDSAGDSGLASETWTTDTFVAAYSEVICSNLAACVGLELNGRTYADVPNFMAACTAWLSGETRTSMGACPNFDPVAAQACVDAFTGISCPSFINAEPGACDQVCR